MPQTVSEIRALLAAAGLAPQHRFGQNFLVDLNLMRKLVAAAAPTSDDVVLEVGPGTGSLTELLLESGARIVAAEIDRGLAALLRERLGSNPRFTLVEGDALARKHEIAPAILAALRADPPSSIGGYKLIANLPYQIATPLLLNLLHTQPALASLTCTIQREVGQRLAAVAGSDEYGPLSIVAQSLAQVETLATLGPRAFWPAPKVSSAMVQLTPLGAGEIAPGESAPFARFVQDAFGRRRKMMRRIVRDWDVPDADGLLAAAEVTPRARPEELAPATWRRLFRLLQSPCR